MQTNGTYAKWDVANADQVYPTDVAVTVESKGKNTLPTFVFNDITNIT